MKRESVTMAAFDRTADSIGNIVLLEHYNASVDDQRLATLFYVTALGGTRDPYLFTGMDNMWVNFGRTQVHLPSRGTSPRSQLLRGTLGFVVPDLDAMRARLGFAMAEMQRVAPGRALHFDATDTHDHIDLHCPWGTRVRCHAPSDAFDGVQLGLVYIDFDVPPGTAQGIARFYSQVIKAPAQVSGRQAIVRAGLFQTLRFTERDAPLPDYDGHHFLIYLADFAGPHAWLREHGLLTRDEAPHEWRFEWICDPLDGHRLFQVEHEVRSTRHPLFNRVLVNRDTALTNVNYRRGREDFGGVY